MAPPLGNRIGSKGSAFRSRTRRRRLSEELYAPGAVRAQRTLLPLVVLLSLALGACAVSLAPSYDPSLVSEISAANEQALTLFSAVQDGSSSAEFPDYAATYDQVIGELAALRMLAAARPVPPLSKRVAERLADAGVLDEVCSEPTECVNASPSQLDAAAENLSQMRAKHRRSGLEPDVIALFRNAHEISLDQALQVEVALKRK